ncbi:hypothetical protein B5M50_04155 [candidate division KSB1 bacterium 4484_219]|nr:MAG: hypothetical protein B5M50_04155 [candidate division KSB1 bacterium 4484_219]
MKFVIKEVFESLQKKKIYNENMINPKHYRFCPMCGAKLQSQRLHNRIRLVCPHCRYVFYQNPTPAVGVILMRNNEILLVQRKYEPRAGDWSLPAGFIEYDEEVEQAAVRELKEETNLDIRLTGLFEVYSGKDDPRSHVVLILYRGEIIGGELRAGDDAIAARFFPLDQLPENIAFCCHRQAIEKLKSDIL